jgi:hypothetical protein
MYEPTPREGQSQHTVDGGGLYHGVESLIVVHTRVNPRRTQRALYWSREPSALNLFKSVMRKSNWRTESVERRSWSGWSLESTTWKERVGADVGISPPDSRCCRRPLLFPLSSLSLPLVVQRIGWPLRSGPRSCAQASVDLPLRGPGGGGDSRRGRKGWWHCGTTRIVPVHQSRPLCGSYVGLQCGTA